LKIFNHWEKIVLSLDGISRAGGQPFIVAPTALLPQILPKYSIVCGAEHYMYDQKRRDTPKLSA
jgi:hypothetical protein